MRGGDRDATARDMIADQSRKQRGSRGVERGHGLVEQPQDALDEGQAGKTDAPALSLRQYPCRQMALPRESDVIECRAHALTIGYAFGQGHERDKVFFRGELVLERRSVPREGDSV